MVRNRSWRVRTKLDLSRAREKQKKNNILTINTNLLQDCACNERVMLPV